MQGRTYRYFKGEPLYPFGYGLSYSTFAYSGLSARRTASSAEASATVKNTSSRDGDEAVQLYIGGGADLDAPIRNLRGIQRIHLKAGESRQVRFTLGSENAPKTKVEISLGGGQPLAGVPHVEGVL
jgi:beta-glucosidase